MFQLACFALGGALAITFAVVVTVMFSPGTQSEERKAYEEGKR